MIIKGLLKRLFNDYWKGGRGRMIKYDYLLIINIWLLEVYSKSIEGLSIDYPEMIIERIFEDYWKKSAYLIHLQTDGDDNARTYLQLPLRQWGAGNVYLLVLSSWKVNIAENPIAVMGL